MLDSKFEMQKINGWIAEGMTLLGILPGAFNLKVEFNGRFCSRLGDAVYNPENNLGRIRFSSKIWDLCPEDEKRQTVLHELCHVVNWWRGITNPISASLEGWESGHGKTWCRLMIRCGLKPRRCHSVKIPKSLKKKMTRYRAWCKCTSIVHNISAIMKTKIQRGEKRFCAQCHQCISLQKPLNPL